MIGYYIPWLDHVLDVAATPAAIAAGMVTSASVFADLPPLVRWLRPSWVGEAWQRWCRGRPWRLRAGSAAATGGLGNVLIATGELAGSVIVSTLALLLPLVAVVVALAFAWTVYAVARRVLRRLRRGSGYRPRTTAWGSSASGRP